MGKLLITIKNGYGIGELDLDLPFDASAAYPHQDTNIIYAQNGVMKSSFTRTLRDYSQGNPIMDHIFNLPGTCIISSDSGSTFPAANVISIPSFDSEVFNCSNMSALLVNSKQREEYDALMKQYDDAYTVFITRLKNVSGVGSRTTPEQLLDIICPVLSESAKHTPEMFVQLVKGFRDQIEIQPDFILQLPYSVVGTSDAQKFAKDNEGTISDLMKAYNEVKASASFVRGGFDSGNAQKLAKEIERSKFFEVDHGVELFNNATRKLEKVTDIEDLKARLATDIDIVLTKYPNLRKKFDKMITDLSTASRLDLKRIIEGEDTKDIIILMNDARMYKRRLWWGYLKGCLAEFDELQAVADSIKEPLDKIVKAAQHEATKWDETVQQFNHRFRNLPYHVEIENKSNVVLKDKIPELIFVYNHPLHSDKFFRTESEHKTILSRLSTGERKAFYLLNVMFEIEVAQQSGNEHLVVLDDIVDSFDYKNKYAFLEYLYDISAHYNHIKLIILTHNFDFFRLLQLRLFGENYRKHAWFAQKQHNSGKVTVTPGGQFRVISFTREQAPHDPIMWFALIPFARNVIEYKTTDVTSDSSYQMLTECLHDLDVAHTIQDVQAVLDTQLGITSSPLPLTSDFEAELMQAAEAINAGTSDNIVIQQNLVLAIATRLLAEKYMKSKMTVAEISAAKAEENKFTRALFDRYVASVTPADEDQLLLDKVNLMTPEHIHVNAFMYEPLIDLGLDELKELYRDIKALNDANNSSIIPASTPIAASEETQATV